MKTSSAGLLSVPGSAGGSVSQACDGCETRQMLQASSQSKENSATVARASLRFMSFSRSEVAGIVPAPGVYCKCAEERFA